MKPTRCGKCGADLVKVTGRSELFDLTDRVWTGLLDCPSCGAMYVYIRPGPPPSRQLALLMEGT